MYPLHTLRAPECGHHAQNLSQLSEVSQETCWYCKTLQGIDNLGETRQGLKLFRKVWGVREGWSQQRLKGAELGRCRWNFPEHRMVH